jgi:GAF domain-containing protein
MAAHGRVGMDDVTVRLRDAAMTLEDLQSLLGGREQLDHVLHRLAGAAVRTIPDASAVSVTVLRDGADPYTAASTDDVAVAIDAGQYASGEGPCLEAARERHPVRVAIEEIRERWPVFAASADRAGMRSSMSAPLLLGDEPMLGSLNVYGHAGHAFDLLDEALITLFTTAASAAIVNARRYVRARERAEEMTLALTSRAEIDQAKGVMMARHGISAEQAFEMLVLQSQRTNTKLRDVARAMIDSVTRPG